MLNEWRASVRLATSRVAPLARLTLQASAGSRGLWVKQALNLWLKEEFLTQNKTFHLQNRK